MQSTLLIPSLSSSSNGCSSLLIRRCFFSSSHNFIAASEAFSAQFACTLIFWCKIELSLLARYQKLPSWRLASPRTTTPHKTCTLAILLQYVCTDAAALLPKTTHLWCGKTPHSVGESCTGSSNCILQFHTTMSCTFARAFCRSMNSVTAPGFVGPASAAYGSNSKIAFQTVYHAPPASFDGASHSPEFCFCQCSLMSALTQTHTGSVPLEVQLACHCPPSLATRRTGCNLLRLATCQ